MSGCMRVVSIMMSISTTAYGNVLVVRNRIKLREHFKLNIICCSRLRGAPDDGFAYGLHLVWAAVNSSAIIQVIQISTSFG